jgi:Dyp-type peroxidase family
MDVNLKEVLDDRVLSEPVKKFMQNLQANILKGHGREHVVLLFLSIKNIDNARKYLHDYPITDSYTQHLESIKFKFDGGCGGVVRLVFLSKSGLIKFGHGTRFDSFGAFSGGMATDSSVLDNGSTESWQDELIKSNDVMLLVAYHNPIKLARIIGNMVKDFSKEDSPFEVVFIQEGRAYKNSAKEGVEHFGYVDGRSQPLMIQSAIDEEKEKKGGIDKYNPTAPLEQFLLNDPLDTNGYGSFFVFRKLEQNVAGFKGAEDKLGEETLGLKGEDAERAGAMVVGRFEDGTPVTLHDEAKKEAPVVNNFNYSADSEGSKCPFHAHIRKSNPRGSSPGGLDFDKSVQMARRGITYGIRLQNPDTKEFIDKPNDGVGLLFMSYQASIEKQFQFMQTKWVNSENFPKDRIGIDPVIGQGDSIDQTWFPSYASTADAKAALFRGFVTLKGGEYYFTPSISGLKNL